MSDKPLTSAPLMAEAAGRFDDGVPPAFSEDPGWHIQDFLDFAPRKVLLDAIDWFRLGALRADHRIAFSLMTRIQLAAVVGVLIEVDSGLLGQDFLDLCSDIGWTIQGEE